MFGRQRFPRLLTFTLIAFAAAGGLAAASGPEDNRSAAQILQREHQYSAALLHGDARSLAAVLADSFVDTSEGGMLRDKQQFLAIIARQRPPESIEETDRRIQVYGNAAVVTVKFKVTGTDGGKRYELSGRATDVWINRGGRWDCVAAHSSGMQ
ncbi:MAG TPA: nuclear transport factor 2 family protein [Steroidobacteraceae bacterium]|nr:nuclear transport factor 2 family protein [Steroidobacteraceae bacterium]